MSSWIKVGDRGLWPQFRMFSWSPPVGPPIPGVVTHVEWNEYRETGYCSVQLDGYIGNSFYAFGNNKPGQLSQTKPKTSKGLEEAFSRFCGVNLNKSGQLGVEK